MASVSPRNDGFIVRWRVNGRQASKMFPTEKAANAHAIKVEEAVSTGTALDPKMGRTTFKDWRVQWTANRQNVKQSTLNASASLYRAHMADRWDTWRLDAIGQQDVQTWVNGLQGKPATRRAAYKDFAQTMKAAVTARYIRESPCFGITLPKIEHEELVLLDHAEVNALADKIKPRYKALILTLAYSGIRIGEASALKWPQVGLEAKTIRVIATATEVQGQGIVETRPKTRAGIRTVPIPQHLVDALTVHRETFSKRGYVFTSQEGLQLNRRNFSKRSFKTAIDALGYELSVHDLRHTAISLWIRAGLDLVRVKTWAGHEDAAFTTNVYGHLFPTDDAALVDRLEANIRKALAT